MRVLLIHSDRFEYESKQPTKVAEELPSDEARSHSFDEVLVVFATVESADTDPAAVSSAAAEDIADIFRKVEAERLVLYPYAHLSPELAGPDLAVAVLKATESALSSKGIEVHRAPFGWYKSFQIKCKGHPLSELSREFTGEEKVTREEVVEKISRTYYILTPEGEEYPVDMEDMETLKVLDDYPSLKTFVLSEELGMSQGKEPPSIKAMQRLELF
ncbi:MAG TPA: threonyl-tRNA synthetase editing domain-containing protein, partial [Thermoplasmata archaeon]|nr:threonyl-tRNA synthetase editing domain-containing protein [Thermoplasmata archaeon]